MTVDLDRITQPLRLAKGSHERGSGKGISYINGDAQITDYPECSARPLAALVQMCNDELADDDGMLSPENSVLVLDLGWQTVGTADMPEAGYALWIAEVLDNPQWGVVRFAKGDGITAVRQIAQLHRDAAAGEIPFAWSAAESAAWSAAWIAALSAAWSAAESAAVIEFTRNAIESWRQIQGLDELAEIRPDAVDSALDRTRSLSNVRK